MTKARTIAVFSMLALSQVMAFAQPSGVDQATKTLFTRLDLDGTHLKNIKFDGDSAEVVKRLLHYYQSRSSVKHPIYITDSEKVTDRELKWANDALEHVFVGQPAYPSHFCGKDINWNSRPVPDNEWVWQLNRMYFWNAMAKVYAVTHDERYAKEWFEQLIDWTRKNPRDEAHGYAWRSIEAGIRGYNWTALFYRFIQSEHFTPEVLVAFLNSCYEHAEFLMTKYSTGSNWGLMEAEGLAFIAFTFPEFKNSRAWRTEAIRRLKREIDLQVYSDGHQRELAMGYHIGCIRWFYRTYELAQLNGLEHTFPESYSNSIEKMCEVPMKLCLPDGTNAQFGDAWAGKPAQYADRFKEWSGRFDREDFLFLATNGAQGTAPQRTAYQLPESGLYSLRSGWDKNAICLVLKCGPDGGGHCQPDNGTFTLYAGGRTLMPDAGSYIYHGDPEGRSWFRQTKVHQTLTLNEANTQYNPKLLLWKPGKELDILVVENKGYEDLTHRRSVFFIDKRYFVLVDEATGTGLGDVDLNFQLAPGDAKLNHRQFSVRSDYKDGWNVFIQTQKQKSLELSEVKSWVSFEYTKKEPRPAVRYRIKKTDHQLIKFITLVVPFESSPPDIKVQVKKKPDAKTLQLIVRENGIKRLLEYEL